MDLVPYKNGKLDWDDLGAFAALAKIIKRIADENKTPVTWGGSWRRYPDYPHWQLQ